jgi:hypothetical protein
MALSRPIAGLDRLAHMEHTKLNIWFIIHALLLIGCGMLRKQTDLQELRTNKLAGTKAPDSNSVSQVASNAGRMENVAQVFVPEYIGIDKFSLAITAHAGGESTTTSNHQNHAAAGSSKSSGGAGTSSKAAASSSGTGPAGDDNDPPKKPSQSPVPHPDDALFPATNQTFRTIPQRLWRRAAARGWRDVPWHALTAVERYERFMMSDIEWLKRELWRTVPSMSEVPLPNIMHGMSPAQVTIAMLLVVDTIWGKLYEAFGGEPHWAAVDMVHHLDSRHRFLLENFDTIFTSIDQNVDVAPLIHPVRDALPPALSDLAPPLSDMMRPPTRQMFVVREAWGYVDAVDAIVILMGGLHFYIVERYLPQSGETNEQH